MRTWSEPLRPGLTAVGPFMFHVCNIFSLHVQFLICSNIFNLHVWPFWATTSFSVFRSNLSKYIYVIHWLGASYWEKLCPRSWVAMFTKPLEMLMTKPVSPSSVENRYDGPLLTDTLQYFFVTDLVRPRNVEALTPNPHLTALQPSHVLFPVFL